MTRLFAVFVVLFSLCAVTFSISVFAQSPDSNLLEWDSAPNALGIIVWSKPGECNSPGMWAENLPELPGNSTQYVDGNLTDPFAWCYRVTARYAGGLSGYSNEAGKAPALVNFRAR